MDKVLEINDLVVEIESNGKYYKVLNGVTFSIDAKEMVGVVGESGCGKSITSLSIMKLLPKTSRISSGSIRVNNIDITSLKNDEMCSIRGRDVSMIFQEPMTALNPLITVGKQISECYMIHNHCTQKEAYEKAIEIMKRVGLSRCENLYDNYPHQLSGGMKQRIVIAMALINNPGLLIADEPTTALDVTIQFQILNLIRKLNKEFGSSVMLISHDLGVIKEVCTRVIVMYAGYIVEEGETEKVLSNPMHPYTLGLIKSIPSSSKKGEELYTIKGIVDPLYKRNNTGCPFSKRCDYASEICFEKVPDISIVDNGTRKVRCFNLGMVNGNGK